MKKIMKILCLFCILLFTKSISAQDVTDEMLLYFTQPFNDNSQIPAEKPVTEKSIYVKSQGTWKYYYAYKSTNEKYIPDGSKSALRLLKNGSYVITPVINGNAAKLTFTEGRGNRNLEIYTSGNGGSSWTLYKELTTAKTENISITIKDSLVNRFKIANNSGSDADIDNLSVYIYTSGTKPAVSTLSVDSITKNTAIIHCKITNKGSNEIIKQGICWNYSTAPTTNDNNIQASVTGIGTYKIKLSNLPAGKKIHARAYARSLSGTGYGNEISFITEAPEVPEIETIKATEITAETATAGVLISYNGGSDIISKGICISTDSTPDISDSINCSIIATNSFFCKITGIAPSTEYFYCAYAKNEAGTSFGKIYSFTTGEVSMPEISSGKIINKSTYSATISVEIINTGNATVRFGVLYNTTGNPTAKDKSVAFTAKTSGKYTLSLSNLTDSTKYFVKPYITNSAGTSYGEKFSFTTGGNNIFYLSPEGNDNTGDGTFSNPYYSLSMVTERVLPGDSIIMTEGTYHYTERVNINTCGKPGGGTITLCAENGKRALLDFSGMPCDNANQGIRLTGSYWHLYGLDIKGAGDNGMLIERNKPDGGNYEDIINDTTEAHDNIIEYCTFFKNRDTGLQMKNLAMNNKIINCDSYYNRDPDDGDADGFAPKLTLGSGNHFYGCRAWNNSDDGWDGYLKATEAGFPDDITTTIENCWAFRNGYGEDGNKTEGNGNGFKLGGGNKQRHNMILNRCLAFDNMKKDFDQNHNVGNMILNNCTGISANEKDKYSYRLDEAVANGKKIILTNCIAVWNGEDSKKSDFASWRIDGATINKCEMHCSSSDFISVDYADADAPRKADGSLPDIDFMHISENNSKLIDAGIPVEGLSYNGTAPDLGCFETGVQTLVPADKYIYPDNKIKVYYKRNMPLIYLQEEADYVISVFNINGTELIKSEFTGNSIILNCNGLHNGLYVVKIKNSTGETLTTKIIIR